MDRNIVAAAVVSAIVSGLVTTWGIAPAHAQTPPTAVCVLGMPLVAKKELVAAANALVNEQLAAGRTRSATFPVEGSTYTVTCFW